MCRKAMGVTRNISPSSWGKFCGKTVHVLAALSLQYHQYKEETIAVQVGRVRLEVGTQDGDLETLDLVPGDSVHLRTGGCDIASGHW